MINFKDIKSIKSFKNLKDFILDNKESLKKAALPITVVAAVLIFWFNGTSDSANITDYDLQYDTVDISQEEYSDTNKNSDNNSSEGKNENIYVDISGCVNNPGVYMVKEGTRLFQVIDKAGGLKEDADTDSINRAENVFDGQKIVIKSISDNADRADNLYQSSGIDNQGKININFADAATLEQIPGVGPSTAQKIIEYRENIGSFRTIEDIKNVSGIGDKTFEKLKNYITV